MGVDMKLRELLRGRRDWSDEDTIYVVEPWGGDADALLSNATPDITGPIIEDGQSYAYLLDYLNAPDDVDEAACERLIRYATDDA